VPASAPTAGPTVGQYLLLTLLLRAYEPWSRAATGRWFGRDCFLRLVWSAPHRVSSAPIPANLRHLAAAALQKRIERALAQRLVREGLRPSLLLWDLPNGVSQIEEGRSFRRPVTPRIAATAATRSEPVSG
jgi:hypothetical protein